MAVVRSSKTMYVGAKGEEGFASRPRVASMMGRDSSKNIIGGQGRGGCGGGFVLVWTGELRLYIRGNGEEREGRTVRYLRQVQGDFKKIDPRVDGIKVASLGAHANKIKKV